MSKQKRALVCGAGGFIGGHLVKRLKEEGYWVCGVDIKKPEFRASAADQFEVLDLREWDACTHVVWHERRAYDEMYQLAADMGGMGFIHSAEKDIMRNSSRINLNMLEMASVTGVPRYFFSSSVCVYPDMHKTDSPKREFHAYPANPDNEYGWEKLYAERMALCYARHTSMQVRIGRFQNTYGPYGTFDGGREKAPAAICRKVVAAEDGGSIDVWGDGTAIRAYTYIDDLIDGIRVVMQSDCGEPVNIGSPEYVTVDQLAQSIIDISGKSLSINHVAGPVGVASRNFSTGRLQSLGWGTKWGIFSGLLKTYEWISKEMG